MRLLRRVFGAVGATVVVGALLWLVLDVLPGLLVHPEGTVSPADRLKAENDSRTTLVQALGGTILLVGLYFTARNVVIAREGQITDRFTKAIDQLGNRNLDVRLGGIYALERIARESAKDHGPIMEVLTAFLREHARWQLDTVLDDERPRRLRSDVQAIVTVLGRRPEVRRRAESQVLDLQEVDVRAGILHFAHLVGANLRGAHLEGANLDSAHLEGAKLRDAHLEGANLSYARLEQADLNSAHLERAILLLAHLEGADLRGAHLEGADLSSTRLESGILRFGGAHLEGADLRGAHLENANLDRAYLEGADLRGAHLEGANLSGAHLKGADLSSTDLSTAKELTRAQLEVTIIDEITTLPIF